MLIWKWNIQKRIPVVNVIAFSHWVWKEKVLGTLNYSREIREIKLVLNQETECEYLLLWVGENGSDLIS